LTKQDYQLIADCIAETRKSYPEVDAQMALNRLTTNLCDSLRHGNARFDGFKFKKAAGYNGERGE
jgi:hypothetical protein